MEGILRPEMVPIWGTVFGTLMVFGIVAVVFWYKAREKELQVHQDMRIRETSMQQLLAHMKAMNTAYGKLGALSWIVGGDFNTAPDEPRFASEKTIPNLRAAGFRWCWEGIPFNSRITVPADLRYPAASFDHIFYRGATLVKAWVANTSPQSSDHRAVNTVFSLRPGPKIPADLQLCRLHHKNFPGFRIPAGSSASLIAR